MFHLPSIYAGLKWRCFSTQYTPAILTPSILSRARRRTFHSYPCTRSSDIWPTRTALLAYERALELEAQIDALNSPLTPTRARSRSRSVSSRLISGSPVKSEAGLTGEMPLVEGEDVVKESQRICDAREVLAIFETAYAEWKTLGDCNRDPRPRGLERFDRGMFSRTFIYASI
jgi:Fanconi-associated nuclease 1